MANLTIQVTQDIIIAHQCLLAARVLPSSDIILLTATVDDVDQLTRKDNWICAFGVNACI